MKKRYQLNSGMDVSITLSIDTDKVTPEAAKEVVYFWSSGDEVLRESNGDVYQAYARRAASGLLYRLLEGFHEQGAVDDLGEGEGWPGKASIGITIDTYELPELGSRDFEVEELQP